MAALSRQAGAALSRSWVSPACYNYHNLETMLHQQFRANRGIGEYFGLAFDAAVQAASELPYQLQNDERDRLIAENLRKIQREVADAFVPNYGRALPDDDQPLPDAQQDDELLPSGLMNVRTAAECLGITDVDVIVEIGMNYDDFMVFGPLQSPDNQLLLNEAHICLLVALIPTTDHVRKLKVKLATLASRPDLAVSA